MRIAIDKQRQVGPLAYRMEVSGDVARQDAQIRFFEMNFDAARLHAREIEQRIDEAKKSQRVAVGDSHFFAALRRQLLGMA